MNNNTENNAQIYLLQKSRILSKAYWPDAMQICARTSCNAQRLRILRLHGIWCIDILTILHLRMLTFFSRRITIAHAIRFGVIVLATALVMTLFLLYNWSILLVFLVLCMMTTLIILQLCFSDELSVTAISLAFEASLIEEPALPPLPITQQGVRAAEMQLFPETPMPATPLIRVLETIDLSSTSIEHFIESER